MNEGDEVVYTQKYLQFIKWVHGVPKKGIVREVRSEKFALVQWEGQPNETLVRRTNIEPAFNIN